MAIIDPAIVKGLVEAQLLTIDSAVVAAGSVFFPGEPEPDELTRWVRLVAIDITSQERPRSGAGQDEPDHADVVVTVNCSVATVAMRASSGALASVQAAVKKALGDATLRDVATNHQVDLTASRVITDAAEDQQRGCRTGAVIFEGTVCRTSGSTMTPFVA